MKHEWLDFKASAENHKGPGKMWTYYRCKRCGKIVEEKTEDECSGILRYGSTPYTEIEAGVALLPELIRDLEFSKNHHELEMAQKLQTIIAALEAAATLSARVREPEGALKEARRNALEEAAQRVLRFSDGGKYADDHDTKLCEHLATTIRALSPQKQDEENKSDKT